MDLTTHTSLSPIRRGFAPGFVNYKKGALDSQPQVIKFNSCLSFCTFSLAIVLSVLRCTDSDYSLWLLQTLLTLVDLI